MEITKKDVSKLRQEADNLEKRLSANQFEEALKDRITAAIAAMRDVANIWEETLQKNRIEVAIESTEDYTEKLFQKKQIEINIQNQDGTYGKVNDQYRLVTIGKDGYVKPFNNILHPSAEAARQSVEHDDTVKLISYDTLIENVTKNQLEKNNEPLHPGKAQLDGITLEGFFGTWHPIACAESHGIPFYLMEHDEFGNDAACVIITRYGDVILDEVYNGFDDLWEYIESEYQEEVEVIKAGYPPKEYLVKALQHVNMVYQKEFTVAELRTLYQKKTEPIERKGVVREAIQLFQGEELTLEKKDLTMGHVNKRVFGQGNCEERSL